MSTSNKNQITVRPRQYASYALRALMLAFARYTSNQFPVTTLLVARNGTDDEGSAICYPAADPSSTEDWLIRVIHMPRATTNPSHSTLSTVVELLRWSRVYRSENEYVFCTTGYLGVRAQKERTPSFSLGSGKGLRPYNPVGFIFTPISTRVPHRTRSRVLATSLSTGLRSGARASPQLNFHSLRSGYSLHSAYTSYGSSQTPNMAV